MENSITVLQDNILSIIEAVNERFDYKYIFKINYNSTINNPKSFSELLNILNQNSYSFVGDTPDDNETDTFTRGRYFVLQNNTVTDILERKMNNNDEISSHLDSSYNNSSIYIDVHSILTTY
tara:strand:+ start:28 stop:393 length:366 start_codon:yes stop_codon:yes gene_type:complete